MFTRTTLAVFALSLVPLAQEAATESLVETLGRPLMRLPAGGTAVDRSTDGSQVLVADDDGLVLVLDATTGETLHEIDTQLPLTNGAGFCRKDRLFVTTSWLPDSQSGLVTVWSVNSGKEKLRVEIPHLTTSEIVVTDDLLFARAGEKDKNLVAVDLKKGTITRSKAVTSPVFGGMVATPDGKSLLVGGGFRKYKLEEFDPETLEKRGDLEAPGGMTQLAMSADGTKLAARDPQGEVWVMDWETKKVLGTADVTPDVEFENIPGQLMPTGKGGQVLISTFGARLFGVDVESGELFTDIGEHRAGIMDFVVLDDARAFSTSSMGFVRFWNLGTGRETNRPAGHANEVTSLTWSSDGATLCSGSYDGVVCLWSPTKPEPLAVSLDSKYAVMASCALPAKGGFVTGTAGGNFATWNPNEPTEAVAAATREFQPYRLYTLEGGGVWARDLWESGLFEFDAKTFERGAQVPLEGDEILEFAASSDGKRVASIDRFGVLRLFDPKTPAKALGSLQLEEYAGALAVGGDGTVAYLTIEGVCRVHAKFSEQPSFERELSPRELLDEDDSYNLLLAIDPASKSVAAVVDTALTVLSIETGEALADLARERVWPTSLAWSPDGSTLAIGAFDSAIRLWRR